MDEEPMEIDEPQLPQLRIEEDFENIQEGHQQQPQEQEDEAFVEGYANVLRPEVQIGARRVIIRDLLDLIADDDEDDEDFDIASFSSEDDTDSDSWSSPDDDIDTKLMRQFFSKSRPGSYKDCPVYNFKPFRLMRVDFKDNDLNCVYPSSRSGHRVIASESDLYCLGGYNPHTPLTPAQRQRSELFLELWKYNFASNTWKLLLNSENCENMPRELASNALILYRNVLVSHGGTGYPFGESCSNDCYVYLVDNTKPSVVSLPVTGDLPLAQYGPGIAIHEDYLYTIGGTTGFEYSCDVYRLNLATKKWENVYICRPELRDDPAGRYRHEVVYDGNYIFVLGGGTSNEVFDLKRIPAFNVRKNKWEHIETRPDAYLNAVATEAEPDVGYPKARKCFSCVQHTTSTGDIEAFITGGLQGDVTNYYNDIWRLNLRTMQWTFIRTATLPRPLYFHSAAHAGNGCMYIFGGIEYTEKYTRRRNDLYKMWLTIPKLSEICWDAITYYNSRLNFKSRHQLLKAGIPEKFMERLELQEPVKKTRFPDMLNRIEYRKRHRMSL